MGGNELWTIRGGQQDHKLRTLSWFARFEDFPTVGIYDALDDGKS
jgi:hypothetical protein